MAINSVVGYWSLVVRYSISELKSLLNDQLLMSVRVAAFGVAGLANDQGPTTNDAFTILLSSPYHWYRCTFCLQSSLLLRQLDGRKAGCVRPAPAPRPAHTGRHFQLQLSRCPAQSRRLGR